MIEKRRKKVAKSIILYASKQYGKQNCSQDFALVINGHDCCRSLYVINIVQSQWLFMQHNFLMKFNEKVWAEKNCRLIDCNYASYVKHENNRKKKRFSIENYANWRWEKNMDFFSSRKWILSERKIGVHNGIITVQHHTADLWSILVQYIKNDLRFR